MAGFFRRVAGAFVEFEDEQGGEASGLEGIQLDELTDDAAELLSQLEGPGRGTPSAEGGAQVVAEGGVEATDGVVGFNADQVFASAGLPDSPHSAQRLIKIIAGLSAFPPEQQLAMVRAMDAADDSWTEDEVMADAGRRKLALEQHVAAIERDRQQRSEALSQAIASAQEQGAAQLSELDQRIAELYKQREQLAADNAVSVSQLQAQQAELARQADGARQRMHQVILAFDNLMAFFGRDPRASGRS